MDCTTEFRFYWMHTKLKEDMQPTDLRLHSHPTRQFVPLPPYPATQGGLTAAYRDPVPFTRDGLYLVHRRTVYASGHTPLALLWKDAACSPYFIDTDAKGTPLEQQRVILQYRAADRALVTGDELPVVLATMPEGHALLNEDSLRDGQLTRFTLGPEGVTFIDGHPIGADLEFQALQSKRGGRAHVLSKILFQYLARTHPITFEVLLEAAGMGPAPEEGGAGARQGESIGVGSTLHAGFDSKQSFDVHLD